MKLTESNIFAELERLAAAFPWDQVAIWVERKPPGEVKFVAYVPSKSEAGISYVFGNGMNPTDAVNEALKESERRDPEVARQTKLRELREQIAKLKEMTVGLPPYRPNRELAAGSLRDCQPALGPLAG